MKKIYIKIYAVVALLFILGTVVWFLFGIINDSKKGAVDAENTFAYFARLAIKLAEKEEFASTDYNKILGSQAKEMGIKAFILSDLQKKILISWSEDENSKNNYIEFDKDKNIIIKDTGFFTKSFTINIQLNNSQKQKQSFIITGAIPTLKSNAIFVRSRSAFFVVLTIIILTLLIILLQSFPVSEEKVFAEIPKQNQTVQIQDEVYPIQNEEYKKDIQNTMQEIPATAEAYDNIYDMPDEMEAVEEEPILPLLDIDDTEYSLEDLDDLTITKKYPYESKHNDTTVIIESMPKPQNIGELIEEDFYQENKSENDNSSEQQNERYSKTTGVSLATGLHRKLETELRSSAATEQDMALVIITLKDLSLESIVAKRIAQTLIEFIKFKDMIFEYDDTGFATIMSNTDLDAAISQAEHIYKHIQRILEEYKISEPIAMGITTRATRLMDANRMIEEARASLARAIRTPKDPIVAFRVNPDKYRKFISET